MEPEPKVQTDSYSLREKIDFESWFFEQMLEMTRVQSIPDLKTYENMLNTLIMRLSAWWPEGFEAEWKKIRELDPTKMTQDERQSRPPDEINKERLELKELALSRLINEMGIGFTKKKKMHITEGVKPLWDLYPPFPPSSETSSKN